MKIARTLLLLANLTRLVPLNPIMLVDLTERVIAPNVPTAEGAAPLERVRRACVVKVPRSLRS